MAMADDDLTPTEYTPNFTTSDTTTLTEDTPDDPSLEETAADDGVTLSEESVLDDEAVLDEDTLLATQAGTGGFDGGGQDQTAELGDEGSDEEGVIVESPYDRPGQWFVVHTYAGYENKVKNNLMSRIASMNMEERIFEVVIPMEDVAE